MESKAAQGAVLFSLDDVPLKNKVKDLVQFAGYDADRYGVGNFQGIALDVFIGTYQSMYPFEKMPQGNGLSTDPLTDPLLSDILQEGQEMKVQHVMNGLKRALKRLYGASTLGDTNNPKKSMSTVVRPRSASATRGRPKSAGGNKKGGSPQKGKSIKDYSSEDIFRRSLGGADRSGLVNRVLTKSASSSLTTPEDVLTANIKANAGHSIKLLESITADDVVEGDVKATGIMIGLVYQEWYRMCVLDTDGASRAKEMMTFFRSPSPSPMMGGGSGANSRSATPTSQAKKGAKPGGRRGSVFVPSGGFKKDPRVERHSSRMVPLKHQNNPKMRERETMYIISLHTVDPLRSSKLEEERLAHDKVQARAKKERQRTIAMEKAEKRRQDELDEEMEKLMGEGEGEGEEKDGGVESRSRSRSASRGRGRRKQYTDDGVEIPPYLQKPRTVKKKKATKMRVKPVNTRSCDTPSNPFVEHVVSWEPPVLPKGDDIGPRDVKRMRVRNQVERLLRTVSPDGKKLPSPVEMPSRSPSPTATATNTGTREAAAEEKHDEHPHRHVHHHPEDEEHPDHPHRHVHHHPEDKEHPDHPHRHVHHHPEDEERPSSPQRAAAKQTMDFVHSSVNAKLSLGSLGDAKMEGEREAGTAAADGEGGANEDEEDAYADEYDDFEDYGADEWEDEGEGGAQEQAQEQEMADAGRHLYGHTGNEHTHGTAEEGHMGGHDDEEREEGEEGVNPYAKYGYVPPPTKTVRATSPTLYQPRIHVPPPGYRAHDPDEWGPPPKKKSHPTELRDIVDYHSRHSGFGMFLLDKLVHRTRNTTGGMAEPAPGGKARPSSAAPAIGGSNKKRRSKSMKKSGKGKRGKSKSRSGSRSGRPGGKGSDHGGKAGKGQALDASYDSGADLLSEASAATDSEKPAKLVPHHLGPAFPAHPIGQADKAYFEASMSVEVLGGEISDIVDPKEIPRVAHTKMHAPRRGRGRHGRPVSAPAGRRPTTGRVAEGVEADGEDDEDVFTRLYKGAALLPRDADFTDPEYLRSVGFDKAEIRQVLRQSMPQTHLGPGGVFKASHGGETAYVAYDSQTGHISTVTEREREDNERRWRESNQVTDDDLDAFRLNDGKMSPPVDMRGNLQWAPVSSHVNLFGSPVKHMAAAMPTSPQWPGYNTGKRTDEWIARARRQVRVEKFSQVGGVRVGHDQNQAIAAFAIETERILSDTSSLLQYRAIMAAMRPGDVVVMIEHCHMCHLHATTLRHKEEEYSLIANQFLKSLVETLFTEGVCARIGVVRFGTPLSKLGPPPLSAEKVVASVSHPQLGMSPGAPTHTHSHDESCMHDTHGHFSSTAATPGMDTGGLSGASASHRLDDPSGFTATTMAGQDLEHAPKPLADLSTGLRGFLPQQRHSPGDLKRDTEEQILRNRLSSPLATQGMRTKTPPVTPQKLGRLGAFEIQIAYRPLEEEEEGGGEMGAVSRELLHSKLASQRWPSRSVVARRCRAFLSRYNVPTYSSKGGHVPSEGGEEGQSAPHSFKSDGPYPVGWHVPLGATDVGRAEEYAYSAPRDSLGHVPTEGEETVDDARALAGIQWVYDTSSAASMAFFAVGDHVWVTGAPHPLGGHEAGWLMATVQAVQEKELVSAKDGKSRKDKGKASMEVLLKYHETAVSVPAASCLATSAPSLPSVCTKVYPHDGSMPLPLAALLFHGLPDSRKSTSVAAEGTSGLWRVLHRLDRKDDSTGVVSVCRHSMFHQLRNLAKQVGEKMRRDAAKRLSAKSNHGTLVEKPDGPVVRLPSGEEVALEHAYSEPVLAWIYGETSSSGTQAARRKLESEKVVNTADLEALAVVMMRRKGVVAAKLAVPASPTPSAAPLSPTYLEESFEALSPDKKGGSEARKDEKAAEPEKPQPVSVPAAADPQEALNQQALESKAFKPPAAETKEAAEAATTADAKAGSRAAKESPSDASPGEAEEEGGDGENRDKLGSFDDAGAEESNDLIGGSPDHSTSLSQSQNTHSGPSASRTSKETEGTAEARHDTPHPFAMSSESVAEQKGEPPIITGTAAEAKPSTDNVVSPAHTQAAALEDSQISGVTMPGMGPGASLDATTSSDPTSDPRLQQQQDTGEQPLSTPRNQEEGKGGADESKGGEEAGDLEAMTTPAPTLAQAGKTQSQMSTSIANYLGDDEEDGNKSQSSGELSDSAMQALMTASSPSLLAAKVEEENKERERKEKEEELSKAKDAKAEEPKAAPKVTIVRDIRAEFGDFSPTSLSPSSSTDSDKPKKAPPQTESTKHMSDIQAMLIDSMSKSSGNGDYDEDYGSDFDD